MSTISIKTTQNAYIIKLRDLESQTKTNFSNFTPLLTKKLENLRYFRISELLTVILHKLHPFSAESQKSFEKRAIVLEELLYEEIHCEKWDTVSIDLRDAFSVLSLIKILNYLAEKDFLEQNVFLDSVIKFADMGILLGGEEFRLCLAEFARIFNGF